MSKEIKQKADSLVDMFVDLKLKDNKEVFIFPYPEDAIVVAIKHQERLIEVLDKHRRLRDNHTSINLELLEQKAILTELQSRL